ncbi:hypothetical protein J4E86_010558 [Alternaria arbusti]|uniref:uncharacterized protein n=1 Tax=Alternaria arbusti TaxID=232088 RepID=UPI0022207B0B|nr:uncharacterized protein J4E86_010558 [Alternaria arbusti]KAI4941058.1 hypothetical protein J4E86_010558 [Alternaria arbusti]
MSTLRLATASNVRAFQILTEALNASNGKWSQWIESETLDDEVGRFRVWAGNLGALQKGHSSLDYRLRGSPVLFSSALRLLNELEQNLNETYAIVSEARLPYEQQTPSEGSDDDSDRGSSSEEEEHDSDSDEPRSELRMRYEEIVDIIDNLYKLSVRIRTPTVRSRSLKASAYTPVDPETGVDILGVYAELDRKHVRELLSQLRKTHPAQNEEDRDFLTERLSSSITLRRRHFKYWKRHRDKLGASADSEDIADAGKPTANEAPAPMRHDTLEAHPPMPTINTPKPTPSQKTGKTLLSGTEATHHHQSLDDIVDTKSVTSYAVTVKDLDGKGIDLPPPPKAATCDKDFECPYCWIVCPARYGKGRAWKTHLLQDLQPYICTHRDCESSELLFRSRREWAEHEATHRKLWRCPEHVNALYNTQAGLENHLRQEHIGSFPDDQIAIMAKIGETIAVDSREKCPICFVPTATEGLGDLQSHIANHLERLATFALPHGREDDEDSASSVASRGSSNSQSLPESISTGSSNEMVALNRDLETEQSVETELNEEDRLLIQLKEEEHLLWTEVAARFQETFGGIYRIPVLQLRLKRLRDERFKRDLESVISEEDLLLLQLGDTENVSWEDITARFQKAFGKEYITPRFQPRIERLYKGPSKQSPQSVGTSPGLLSAEMLQQLPDESQNRLAMFSNQVDDLDDSEDELPENEQTDENILPEHQKHLEEREAFRQHVSSLPGVLSVRFYRGYGSWTGLITFADDLVGEQATALYDYQRFPNVVFKSKKNKSKWTFTRTAGTSKKDGSFVRQPTVDTQTTEEADILPSGSDTYDEEVEESSRQPIITTAEIPTLRSLYQSRRLLQRDQSFAPNDAYNQMISFCHYDLTRLRVDAIVSNASGNFQANPDPDSLHHAIYKAGGSGLREEARSKAKVKVGQVELTHGHNLPSSWVIHAAAPGYTGRKGVGQFNVLSECYRSAMRMAANYEFKTIAFPCLGTGGCMFPARVAARIALQEIREYLDSHPTHRPERIIFCVRAAVDEKAYTDFLPVFFPPTHGDLDRARTSDWSANRAALAAQVLEARTQLQNALTAITVTYDFGTQSTVCAHDMRRIDSTLSSIRKYLLGSKELKRSLGDLNLLCSVILTACADIMDMAERARKQGRAGNTQSIWTEANTDIRAKHGFELTSVFDYSWIFANSLEEVLILGKAEPDAMGRARQILETYGVKQKGQDAEGIRDHLDEVLYVREAERPTPKVRGLIQIHQIPPVARLYILGQLEAKPTMAKPSTLFNHTVCLLREDITRLEVDIVVNSTDPSFSGMGTLDRSIFKKGGDELRSEVSAFGKCEEGDVKATAGYLLPAKHILHVVPPGVFRSDTKNILRNIYRAILHDAVLMRATSIAIPSIGTGMRNYPRRDCASLAMEEVKRFLESAEPGNGLDKIIFVVFSSNDEFVYKSLLPVYFPPTKGNTSPTILAQQPARVEESSSSSLPVLTDQPSLPVAGTEASPKVASAVDFAMTGIMGQAAANTEVRSGKQPVKSRAWNDDEAKTLMDFELHVGTCKVCKNGLHERTHRLCEPGSHLAEAVLQRTEMSEDAILYSKADKQGQREQLEIPMEQLLPRSMLLISTVAKGGRYMCENTTAQVEKTDMANLDKLISSDSSFKSHDESSEAKHQRSDVEKKIESHRQEIRDQISQLPDSQKMKDLVYQQLSDEVVAAIRLRSGDPDVLQATEQPAVIRVEIKLPSVNTETWAYSWVRVSRSKIEMYPGDYQPDPYGKSIEDAPDASIDLMETVTELTRDHTTAVSLWTAERRSELQARWQFRSSDAADSTALFELFKRALDRSRQEREKNVLAEIEEATSPEPAIAAESGRDVLGDPFVDVNKPDAAKLEDQTQTEDMATCSSKAEDANVVAPDAGPRAVIRVEARASRGASDWTNAILYVYEGKIVVEFEKKDGPDQPYATIDLTNGLPHLGREGSGPEIDHVNMACLQVARRGEWEKPWFLPRETWYFRSHGESDTDAMFNVLQEAVDRNKKVGKRIVSTDVEGMTSPGPTTAPIAQREETREAFDALSFPEWRKWLRDIKDQVDDKHRTDEDTDPQHVAHVDPTSTSSGVSNNSEQDQGESTLEMQILTHLDEDLKTRPGSYIGQRIEDIAAAFKPHYPTFIAYVLRNLATQGKVHNTVDTNTWVISKPGTEYTGPKLSKALGYEVEDALAYEVLLCIKRVGKGMTIPSLASELQMPTLVISPVIQRLTAKGLVSVQSDGERWLLTTQGSSIAHQLKYTLEKAKQELAQNAKPADSDEDASNKLSDRALSYLRSLPGMSGNISDLANTFDTPVAELQPVLEQLGSDGLIRQEPPEETQSVFAERGSDSGEDLQTGRSDRDEFVESVDNSTKASIFARMNELQLEEDTSEDEERERRYLEKKKRWSAGIFKRSHSQARSVDGDSSHSDGEPLDSEIAPTTKPEHESMAPKEEQPTREFASASQASSWRDGRGAKERRETKSNKALADDIREDTEPGTASRLRRMKSARERKHIASSKAKKDGIDDELEDYDGQEEDFV